MLSESLIRTVTATRSVFLSRQNYNDYKNITICIFQYGPVFTVVAAGKRLTFVTLHEDFRTFFMSKDVDFEQAVQEPVHNTGGVLLCVLQFPVLKR